VLAPAFQVVRRPVVQMVGSRHSSLSHPSTTVRATVASPWSWTAVTSPAGQPTSHASTSGVTSSGTDQGRSGGPSSRVGSFANRVVSSTSSASGQAGPGRAVSTERMDRPLCMDPAAHGGAAAPGERRTRGPARASGSPQRVGRAGRRAWGHAQDPFSLGVRRGSRPRAFRCGMATRRVPFRPPPVKPRALRRHLYRIATNPWRCGCRIGPVGWGGSAIFLPALKPTSPVVRPSRYPTSA
jgi:hypothetical protein